jgi:hypothetical protein
MSVKNLFLARPPAMLPSPPLISIIQWKKALRCSPSAIIAVFHSSGLFFLPKSKIRAGKLLVGPGHLQEEHVGGDPHHRYIKAHCRCPVEDRTLQKNIHIADNHGKKLPETIISLKRTVFKLCHSAHLFPNTPRTYLTYD